MTPITESEFDDLHAAFTLGVRLLNSGRKSDRDHAKRINDLAPKMRKLLLEHLKITPLTYDGEFGKWLCEHYASETVYVSEDVWRDNQYEIQLLHSKPKGHTIKPVDRLAAGTFMPSEFYCKRRNDRIKNEIQQFTFKPLTQFPIEEDRTEAHQGSTS